MTIKFADSDRGAEAETVPGEAKVAGVRAADNLAGDRDQMAVALAAVVLMAVVLMAVVLMAVALMAVALMAGDPEDV